MVVVGWLVPIAGAAAVFGINEWRPDVPYCDEYYIVPKFLLAFALPSNVFVLVTISFAHWRVHSEVKHLITPAAGLAAILDYRHCVLCLATGIGDER